MKLLSFIDYPYLCCLSMARIATCQTLYLVFLHQFSAHGNLVRRWSIDRIENILLGPDVTLRMFMAVNAPSHVEGIFPPRNRHFSKLSVTRRATYPFADMNAVVEVDKVGKAVDAVPQDRFPSPVTGPDRLQHGSVRPKLRVAGHAGVRRRNARIPRILHRRVAIAAVDPKLGCMVLMAKGNRLWKWTLDVREVRRLVYLPTDVADQAYDENNANDARLSNGVNAAMKNLRHF
jgi:hypothetical protein